jgi:transcriptional antiterminator RfaH
MRRWYLIHTKPAGERGAQLHLQRQGYQTYLPRLLQQVRRRGQLQAQVVPLFPRYLFLHLDEGRQCLTPVRSTAGVASVVRFGACFATVPEQIIGELRARADPQTGLHALRTPPPGPGMPVRIEGGAFAGLPPRRAPRGGAAAAVGRGAQGALPCHTGECGVLRAMTHRPLRREG